MSLTFLCNPKHDFKYCRFKKKNWRKEEISKGKWKETEGNESDTLRRTETLVMLEEFLTVHDKTKVELKGHLDSVLVFISTYNPSFKQILG
jgi:hypothetical protein